MLMEGIKEELFQLEVERKQGQISPAEYERLKPPSIKLWSGH